MQSNQIVRVIILGALTIIGILGIQSYWVYTTWDLNQDEFKQKVVLALYRTASSIAKVNESVLPARDIIKQRTGNYYIVNIDSEIDAGMLEFYLRRELESLALNIDFEYAIYDCDSEQMVYGNYCHYSTQIDESISPTTLPKYSSSFNYYFGVKFPTRSGYLFDQMQLAILFSGILLLTLIFFGYSVSVILRQKRLSEMQKAFINNMTHEFKTPLSTIRISTDVFLRSTPIQSDPRLARYAQIISDQHKRLTDQVERVLQMARIDRKKGELKIEKVSINEILLAVLSSGQVSIQEKGGELQNNLIEPSPIIRADAFHLSNILHCLIDNAIKYSREEPKIRVETIERNGFVALTIVDEGIGIATDYQKQVFEQFFRVPTGNIHDVKGFGLGLYYVKQICLAHEWKLVLDSIPDQGTKVEIMIPKVDFKKEI